MTAVPCVSLGVKPKPYIVGTAEPGLKLPPSFNNTPVLHINLLSYLPLSILQARILYTL